MNRLKHIVLLLGIGIFFAQDPPAGFKVNQSTQQAFYLFATVTLNGQAAESEDWVGAFKGDICVGSLQWDTSQCGGNA